MWNIEGYSGQNHVYKVTEKTAMRFNFKVHTNAGQPLIIDDAEKLLNDGYHPLLILS
ncbi:unnamed protein product, partial [marine sediment metagenome]